MIQASKKSTRAVGLTIFSVALSAAGFSGGVESLLDIRVPAFEFHGKSKVRGHLAGNSVGELPEAAMKLGDHADLRICIEEVAPRLPHSSVPIEVSVKDKTVGEILQLMVTQDARYEFQEKLGVIEVFPVGATEDPENCLNMAIPLLRINYPWSVAWGQVRCQIQIISRDPNDIVPDPLAAGRCWGRSHLPGLPEKLVQATIERRTVRQILNELVVMGGNVAWFAHFEDGPPNCGNLGLATYQPKTMHRRTNTSSPAFTEIPPTECLSCHYHKPFGSK